MMDKGSMRPHHWWTFRHPFLATGLAALAVVGMNVRLGYSLKTGLIWGSCMAVFVLVLWWPRHGVLSRQTQFWLDDDDPRVVKPDP